MDAGAERRRRLDELGYVMLDPLLDAREQEELREAVNGLFTKEGLAAGAEFKQELGARRLANLVNKGTIFLRLVSHPEVLTLVREVLGPSFKLSSANARSVNPQSHTPQPLHCDMGAVADELGYWVCNVLWMLDDFTAENGSLRVVPGSHLSGKLPQDELADPCAPHPDEQLLTGPCGAILVMNAHLWHGGTGNYTDHPRTAVHAFYCRRDKPQQQYQKRLLDPKVRDALTAEQRDLLAVDDRLNDQLSHDAGPRSGFLR